MYLIITKNNEKILCETADAVKSNKNIDKLYALHEVAYEDIISTSDIRDCIYKNLKGRQADKDDIIKEVQEQLGASKSEISKVITAMKKEKIIYKVIDFPWIGIN